MNTFAGLPVWVWVLVAAVAIAALVYLGVRHLRLRRARRAIDNLIGSVAYDVLKNVLLPTGTGEQIHVNYLLLTQRGLLVVDLFDVPGKVFAGEKMEHWSVFGPERHFTLNNPLPLLYDRIAAVRAVAGDVAVDGRIVFSMRGEFPKGRPESVLRLDCAAGRVPGRRPERWGGRRGVRANLGAHQAGGAAQSARRLILFSARGVIGEHLRNAGGEASSRGEMQEFVRPVGVGMWAEHPGNEKLRVREALPQHAHERNAAAGAHVHRVPAEELARGTLHRGLEPRRDWRRFPTAHRRVDLEGYSRAVRRLIQQRALQRLHGHLGIECRGQPQGQPERRIRP